MSKTLLFTQLADSRFSPADMQLLRPRLQLVSGLHKLLQRAVFYLANLPGSVYAQPGVGSARVRQLQSISLSAAADADQLVASIQSDMLLHFQQIPKTLPDAEQLGELRLAVSAIGEDFVVVDVHISSRSGDAAEYSYKLVTVT